MDADLSAENTIVLEKAPTMDVSSSNSDEMAQIEFSEQGRQKNPGRHPLLFVQEKLPERENGCNADPVVLSPACFSRR